MKGRNFSTSRLHNLSQQWTENLQREIVIHMSYPVNGICSSSKFKKGQTSKVLVDLIAAFFRPSLRESVKIKPTKQSKQTNIGLIREGNRVYEKGNPYQASVNGDGEVASDAEVDPITRTSSGATSDRPDGGGRRGDGADALRHGKVGDLEVVGAGHRHRIQGRGRLRRRPSPTVRRRSFAQPNLKHGVLVSGFPRAIVEFRSFMPLIIMGR